jgi:argininosuccinate lyase
MPGYTHVQHAQPVTLAHHLLAYVWMFQRDVERLSDCYRRTDVLPLGSAALAGTSFPIDRAYVAELLGFARISQNSMDAVADRDFAVEFLADASIISMHMSRLAEELIIWNSREFGFVEMDDSMATGSSIMPQKKNPDVAELVRAKTGRVYGDLMSLLTVLKGLPLTYNKDLQEDKESVFDAVDTVLQCVPVFRKLIETTDFRAGRMAQAIQGDFSTATDIADHLVRRGVPFRQAHEIVGRIVAFCEREGKTLESLSADELSGFSEELGEADGSFGVHESIEARDIPGGTSSGRIREQIEAAKKAVAADAS